MKHSNSNNKDTLFTKDFESGSFRFDSSVVNVFDNMIERSIPLYWEMQHILCEYIGGIYRDIVKGSSKEESRSPNKEALKITKKAIKTPPSFTIIDVGCSTANTFLTLIKKQTIPQPQLIGLDASEEMLSVAQRKCNAFSSNATFSWVHDKLENYTPPKSDIIIFNLCLQFTAPENRLKVLKNYVSHLTPNGALILVEKIKLEPKNQSIITNIYHNEKRKAGYSDQEIINKDIALKGVLNPLSEQDNLNLLNDAGLGDINTLISWGPFHAWCARKK